MWSSLMTDGTNSNGDGVDNVDVDLARTMTSYQTKTKWTQRSRLPTSNFF